MTTPYQLSVEQKSYSVVDDLTLLTSVIWYGRVGSNWDNLAAGQLTVEVDHPGIFVKQTPEGFIALAGKVAVLFPELATQAYSVTLQLSAVNHEPAELTISIPINSSFPLPEQTITLAYLPVRIQGRTLLAINNTPVADALVTTQDNGVIALRSPLNHDHAAGTPIRAGSLTIVGVVRVTVAVALSGQQQLQLDNVAGLANGDLLRVGPPQRSLVLTVAAVDVANSEITVLESLSRTIATGEMVQPVNFALAGASQPLLDDTIAGSGLLLLANNLSGTAVQIDDPGPTLVEYHLVGALSDGAGYYRLDGINQRSSITLHATNPAVTHEVTQVWFIAVKRPVNLVDLRLTPI